VKKALENKFSSLLAFVLGPIIHLCRNSKPLRMAYFKTRSERALLIAETDVADFVISTSDSAVGFSTYINRRAFEAEKLALVHDILDVPAELLLDVGANIGTVGISALRSRLVNDVWAFEPEPLNFALLSANVSINNLNDKVTLFNVAVSDGRHDSLALEIAEGNLGDHRVRFTCAAGDYGEDSRRVISVPSVSLDGVCSAIDLRGVLLWMDVQGAEGSVLAGAARLLRASVPIVTEFWPYGLSRAGGFDLFVSHLTSHKYRRVIDLSNPTNHYPCEAETFKELRRVYAAVENGQTDLLVL